MRIVFVQKDPIDILPPLISLMRILLEGGHEVYYLGLTDTSASRLILADLGVHFKVYPFPLIRFREHPIRRLWNAATSKIRPYIFRCWVWRELNRITNGADGATILWPQSMLSAAILGNRAFEYGKRLVCTLYDLGDEAGRKLSGFDINEFYQRATLVECEYNRAHILMAQKNLSRLPFVLPNKPYPHPRGRNLPIADPTARAIVETWGNRTVFLYQGALQSDRGDLFKMIDVVCQNFPQIVVAAMGSPSDTTRGLSRKYPNFSFVPRVAPPHHLEVTSHAHVGLATYKGGTIYGLDPANAVYCAPNKIFEYSGFGMPMLCNDIPGLRYSIGLAHAGECLERVDEESVCAAARKIMGAYDDYSKHATEFFNSVDMHALVKEVLNFTQS